MIAETFGGRLDPADARGQKVSGQEQLARICEPVDQGRARFAREVGVGIRLRRHLGKPQLDVMMDHIAGDDAGHALGGNVDDDMARRMAMAGLEADSPVIIIMVADR